MDAVNKNIEMYRGAVNVIYIDAEGNYTGKTVYFTMKASKALTAVRYVDLSSSSGVAIAYANGITRFTITVPAADTQDLTATKYYYDLDNGTDGKIIAYGDVDMTQDVRTPYDNQTVPAAELYTQLDEKGMTAKVTGAGVITEQNDHGFNTTLTCERLSEGMYKITSAAEIFESDGSMVLLFTPYGCNASDSSLVYSPHFNTNLGYSATELVIGITNENDSQVMDCSFTLRILKVRI